MGLGLVLLGMGPEEHSSFLSSTYAIKSHFLPVTTAAEYADVYSN